MATTAFCNSAKVELMQATHNFSGSTTLTMSGVSGAFTLTGGASTANLSVGMPVSGTNVGAGAVVSAIQSATAVTVSVANAGTITTQSITFAGDIFVILLIKVSPARTFDGTQTNVGTPGSGTPSTSNVGTDETSGSGYTTGGQALGLNTTPVLSSTTAVTTWTTNPSWTSASFSTTAGIIYNTTVRQGAAAAPLAGRTISVHDFGGTQTVSGGTLTLLLPSATSSTAILRIA